MNFYDKHTTFILFDTPFNYNEFKENFFNLKGSRFVQSDRFIYFSYKNKKTKTKQEGRIPKQYIIRTS